MNVYFRLIASLTLLSLVGGCASTSQHAEFVKTINFSSLDTFSFKHTLTSGLDFRESEVMLLEQLSERAVVGELNARGFQQVDADPDFFAVVKWRKAVSLTANPFEHIDPYHEVRARYDDKASRYASRLNLTLEIYESSSGNLFWRKELSNIFSALELTEERVVESLKLALKNFPQHIEKDPNLPDIE